MQILIFSVIAITVLFLVYYFMKQSTSPYMKQVPRKNIADVKDREYVITNGKVIPVDKTLIAPLSGLECVYYHIEIWNGDPYYKNRSVSVSIGGFSVSKGNYGNNVSMLLKEHAEEPFYIEHNGARATVSDPLKLSDKHKMVYESGLFENPSANMLVYLQRHEIDDKAIFGTNRTLFCCEWIIPAGSFITLKGQGQWVDDVKAGVTVSGNRVLSINKGDKKYIYVDFL